MMKKTLRAAALTAAMTAMLSGATFAMPTVTDGQETSEGAVLTYPIVQTDAADAQQRINTVIEDDVKALMQEIDMARMGNKKTSAEMSYKITNSSDDLLSLKTEQLISEEGAAHPMSYTHGYLFRLSDGKALTLDDVQQMSDRKDHAARYTLDALNHRLTEPKNGGPEGYKPLEAAPKDIYMDVDGHIHVLIQRYEAASYAAGVLDIDLDA
ncbi:PdaC/SigV domain-containing protein [Selenomonas sp. oral taxon 138]|uniref:PdaC/SigV domain-containing protein n=1 Tax=Selenomonas sp. oral taxon 138 TaxID=712532 RepID=UPI0002A2DBD0|nr:DUF4163 domain-containing protein [Selenomonas sp. oral taxon 138]EKX95864.1 hypothetical protein HMPREF9163_02072 [Selenomonas sp. oral taxon 138 str. F0429]